MAKTSRKTKAVTLAPFDPAEHLKTEEDIAAYLEAAAEWGDAAHMARALGTVARSRNMSALARDAKMTREGLYKALSGQGNPSFDTVVRVAKAMGFKVRFQPER